MESAEDQLELPQVEAAHDKLTFSITSEEDANWLVGRLLQLRRYRERVEAWAATEIGRSRKDEQRLTNRFEVQLASWLASELKVRGGRRRSVNLPAGEVAFRASPARLVVTDEHAAFEWATQHLVEAIKLDVSASREAAMLVRKRLTGIDMGQVRVKPHVAKSLLQQHFTATGDVPAGTLIDTPKTRLLIR